MKSKFKILTGGKDTVNDDTIVVEPTVSLGDIPYYIEFDSQSLEDSVFNTVYVDSSEKNDMQKIDSAEILVGNKSGKIYQVRLNEPPNRKLLSTIFKKLLSIYSQKIHDESRYTNNIHYSIDIINKAYDKLIETNKLKKAEVEEKVVTLKDIS